MRRARAAAWAVAVLAAASGAGCPRPRSERPERHVPGDAAWAVVVPRLRAAQEAAAPALRTAAQFPAAADLGEGLAAVRAQLGFDPLDPRALADAGVDPDGGAALAATKGGALLLALSAADADRVEALVARVARDRMGAGVREVARVSGRDVAVFRRAPGAAPALAVARAAGLALVSPGERGAQVVAAAAGLAQPSSLAASAPFAAARATLGDGPVAVAFAPAGSPVLAALPLARDGAALGVLASAARLEVRAALLLGKERAAVWDEALPATAAKAGADLAALLPADAFLALRTGAEPAVVARRAAYAFPDAAAALARAGVDLERDVAAALAPGAALGASLAPTFQVAAVSRGGLGSAEEDPFRLVHVSAVAEVKDPARLAAVLDRLARAPPSSGLRVEARRFGDRAGWRVARGRAEVTLATDGKRLYLGAGPGRLEALLARGGAAPYEAPTAASRDALAGGAAAAVLDFGRLVRSFRALPPEAYGTGPDAFVMRSLAERVVDPASRLAAASLRAEATGGAARADLVLEVAAAGSEPR